MPSLTDAEKAALLPAETHSFPAPIPTQVVSSDEFAPIPQTARQRRVEALVKEMGAEHARRNGVSRRRFFQTAAGMATAFAAMNEVYGPLYAVGRALVDVIADRPVARGLAQECGIAHASPQAILFRGGRPVWDASHEAITAAALSAAWGAAGAAPGPSDRG